MTRVIPWSALGATLVAMGLATAVAAFEPVPRAAPGSGLPTIGAARVLRAAPPLAMPPGYIALPPAYPRPPRGFRPLPGPRLPVRATPLDPRGARVWVPGRTAAVLGLDEAGRMVHALEHVPGHVRDVPPRPARPPEMR